MVWKCVSLHSSEHSATHAIPLTSVAPIVGLSVVSNYSKELTISAHETRGLDSCAAKIGHIIQISIS